MEFINRSRAKKQTGLSYLGNVEINPKLMKSTKVSNVKTYSLMLSPSNTSGYNVCPYSTPECRLGCLHNSGRVKVEDRSGKDKIRKARIKRTKLFVEEQEFFMNWLIAEIKAEQIKAKNERLYFAVRLNTLSDIDWTKVYLNGKTIFDVFSDVQFYDYTKNHKMFEKQLPSNYHLTLSYTGRNLQKSIETLNKGNNVAVIFDTPNFPESWNGFPVINGDLTDYRPLDGNGVVVGLKYKELADKEINEELKKSCFVVNTINVPETKITTKLV
jgi:hypothetical protein